MTDFPVWWIEAVSSAFVKIIMKQMVGVFTYIRPINTKNWTAGTIRGVESLETNQADTGGVIMLRIEF